jgi:hypothetical protein
MRRQVQRRAEGVGDARRQVTKRVLYEQKALLLTRFVFTTYGTLTVLTLREKTFLREEKTNATNAPYVRRRAVRV